jgi:hypothetical protein
MIARDDGLQCLECTVCGEVLELRRKDLRNPERMLALKEEMSLEHGPCEEFPEDPERARAERHYRAGMRAEMEKAAQALPGR